MFTSTLEDVASSERKINGKSPGNMLMLSVAYSGILRLLGHVNSQLQQFIG